jgi:hypothetical protein
MRPSAAGGAAANISREKNCFSGEIYFVFNNKSIIILKKRKKKNVFSQTKRHRRQLESLSVYRKRKQIRIISFQAIVFF